MKNQILASLVFLVFFACHEQNDDTNKYSFSKATGDEITQSEAERWIGRYSGILASTRVQGSGAGYKINAQQLNAMLNTQDLVGIAFHHGKDDNGLHHVIAVPLDNTLALWKEGKHVVDANTNESISVQVGEKWSKKYSDEHPNEILYHRFGSDIFSDIKALEYFNEFSIQPALNDEMEPQLVLVVKNETVSNGRTQTAENYYDKSNPGPRCCD
jgi:hypothetical protein